MQGSVATATSPETLPTGDQENSPALDQEVVKANQSNGQELTIEGPRPRRAAASHARDQILAQAVSEQID